MIFKKRSNIGKIISKYVMTGVFLFSSLGIISCTKDEPTPSEPSGPSEEEQRLQKQIEDLQAQITELQALNAEIEALKEQIETSKQEEIAAKQTQINNLNSQIATLTDSLTELQGTIDDLNTQLNELQTANGNMSTQITNLQNQLSDAQSAYNTALADKESLEAQVAQLQEELDAISDIMHYTVTFDSNKGSAVASQEVLAGYKVDKTKVNTTRTGYTLNGWKYGDSWWNLDENIVTGPVTLKADWSPNNYIVNINPNQGTVSPNPTSYSFTFDGSYNLPIPTRDGYTFLGWFDASNKKYSNSGTWKDAKTINLTASWALTNATITYVYNYDCEYPTTQPVTYGETFNLIQPERTGYTFLGWKNGSQTVTGGKAWDFTDSITLEAQWSVNTYTMSLYSGFGEKVEVPVTFDSLDELPVCTDLSEDRPFAGWFLDGEKPVRLTDELGVPLSEWKLAENSDLVAKYFHPISTKEDFEHIVDNNKTIYSLVNDVDLSGIEQQDSFEGTLWGLGYSITGLDWTLDNANVGLFKTIKNATFEDISFKNDTINFVGALDSSYQIGLLASQGSGTNTFRNVSYSSINIDVTCNEASVIAGGLIGRAGDLVLENVTSGGVISAKSSGKTVNIGGFVGKCEGTITSQNYINKTEVICDSLGGVDDISHNSFEGLSGGLVGYATTVNLTDTSNEGIVEGYSVKKDLSYTGGLIGKIVTKLETINCTNKGQVISTKYAGGLIGCISIPATIEVTGLYNEGTLSDAGENGVLGGLIGRSTSALFIRNVFNKGNITSTNGFSGGLIGDAESSCVIEESYNSGTIRSLKGSSGGLVGYGIHVIVNDSYNAGSVEGELYSGGLLGYIDNYSAITNCYVIGNVKLVDSDENGRVGGFVGTSGNLDISKSFIVAELKGINGNIDSVIGEHSCSAESVKSAATFKDMSDTSFDETLSFAQIVDSSLLTDEYIEETLHFSNTKWDFVHEGEPYPTLLCFKESN